MTTTDPAQANAAEPGPVEADAASPDHGGPANAVSNATSPDGSADARPSIGVLDIDGVLADVRHRLHHVAQRPKHYQAFFAAAPQDPPLPEGLAVARRLVEAGHAVVYLSGRPEVCRRDTERWLSRHGFPEGPVFLRPGGDYRPARVSKVEALTELATRYRVAVVVDDDDRVVAAYRAAGFEVLHAQWMDADVAESTVLLDAQEGDGRT